MLILISGRFTILVFFKWQNNKKTSTTYASRLISFEKRGLYRHLPTLLIKTKQHFILRQDIINFMNPWHGNELFVWHVLLLENKYI